MGVLAITMFAGITALAIAVARAHGRGPGGADRLPRRRAAAPRSARSGSRRSATTLPFYLLQGFTAAILVLAANTAFNGFPVLVVAARAATATSRTSSPHRGDRLVFSNGIVAAGAGRRRC